MKLRLHQNSPLKLIAIILTSFLIQLGFGQTADMPRPSPKASVSQTIGVTKIDVNYGGDG